MNGLTNVDIAIYTKVNELGRRFGLQASDVESTFKYDTKTGDAVLSFPNIPLPKNKTQQFGALLTLIGIPLDGPQELRCQDTWEMESRLDGALQKAPRLRNI